MNVDQHRYWFRSKRYGYGYGLPIAWQGWVVLLLWAAAFYLCRRFLVPTQLLCTLCVCPGDGVFTLECLQSQGRTTAMAFWGP